MILPFLAAAIFTFQNCSGPQSASKTAASSETCGADFVPYANGCFLSTSGVDNIASISPITPSEVSTSLTCGIVSSSIPSETNSIDLSASSVGIHLGFNSQLGGVGVSFELMNPAQPTLPVQILEPRNAAGAGWQFSSGAYAANGNGILSNQSDGNSTGTQHGYDAQLSSFSSTSIDSVTSSVWTPAFSDTITSTNGQAQAQDPCPTNAADKAATPTVFDNGAMSVAATTLQSPGGSVIGIEHVYTLNSLQNQNWSSWFAQKALYLSMDVANLGSLRVYAGNRKTGWSAGPLLPQNINYSAQALIDQNRVDHQTNDPNNDSLSTLKTIDNADYVILVWYIHGQDIGIAVYDILGATLRQNLNVYCSDPTDSTCGSIDLITTDGAYQSGASFSQGSVRSYGSHYLVGAPQQLASFGFQIPQP